MFDMTLAEWEMFWFIFWFTAKAFGLFVAVYATIGFGVYGLCLMNILPRKWIGD